MQSEYGKPNSPPNNGTPSQIQFQSLATGPLSVPSGNEWISVSQRDCDGSAVAETFNPWQALPQTQSARNDLDHPFMKGQYVQNLREQYEKQMQQLQQLRDAYPPLFRRLTRLSTLREDVVFLRMRATAESDNCENQRSLVSRSQDAFMQEAEVLLSSLPGDVSTDRLRKLYGQSVEVKEKHDSCAQDARHLETRLSTVEGQMQKLEEKVKDAAYKMNDILRQITFPADSGTATVVESDLYSPPSNHSSDDMPPLIREYFDKAGDVKLEREKLVELDQEHRRERGRRQFERDQDLPQVKSDDDFEEHWLQVFAEAEFGLAEREQEAETALRACRREGLEPDDYRKVSSQTALSAADTPQRESEAAEAATLSTFAQEDSPAVQTPTRHLFFNPLDRLGFNLEDLWDNLPGDLPDPFAPVRKRTRKAGSPLETRVQNWVDSVSNAPEARSRSISESSPLVHVDDFDVPEQWSEERRGSRIRRQRGSRASYLAHRVENDTEDEEAHIVKASSSETELFIFYTRPNAHRRVLADWRNEQVGGYGANPERPSLKSHHSEPVPAAYVE